MPFITFKVAASGAALQDGNESVKGHVWISTDDGNGDRRTYGYVSKNETPIGKGDVWDGDDTKYTGELFYTRTVEVSQEVLDAINGFAELTDAGLSDFSLNYNFLGNNCIDFVIQALNKGLAAAGLPGFPAGELRPAYPTGSIDFERAVAGQNEELLPDDPDYSIVVPVIDHSSIHMSNGCHL